MNKPTKEFLAELLERARQYGHTGDYPAVADFVNELYQEAGIPITRDELKCYQPEYDANGNRTGRFMHEIDNKSVIKEE